MTASKTPRLGLMNPVGSDAFVPLDFSSSFIKLDANPGVLPVPNAAARPADYTAAQHGSLVHQLDLNILWSWNQPTSGSAGAWRRVGNTGLLGSSVPTGSTSTTTTSYNSGVQVAALSVTVPGGRPIQVNISWTELGNTYEKSVVSYWENNVRILDRVFGFLRPPVASAGDFTFARDPAPNASLVLATKVTIASYAAAAPNGGGTTQMGGGQITIWET